MLTLHLRQSYGTVLGQYFAAMYPDKVGRMIFDGVYDSINYRASLWNTNVINNEAVIDSLFTFCHQAGPDGCALYESTPAAIRKRFFAVLESEGVEKFEQAWGQLLETVSASIDAARA